MTDITVEEALRFCEHGAIRCGVPVANAIEAYRRKPNDLTLRTVVVAWVRDRPGAQQQFDCLSGAPLRDWSNRACGDYTPQEIREATLAGVTRTIASMTDQ